MPAHTAAYQARHTRAALEGTAEGKEQKPAVVEVVVVVGAKKVVPTLLNTYQANTTPYVAKPRSFSAVSRWFHEAKDTVTNLKAL